MHRAYSVQLAIAPHHDSSADLSFISVNAVRSNVTGIVGRVTGLDSPPLRLFDVYQNAFLRVLETCLAEIGNKGGNVPLSGDDEFMNNFIVRI